MTTNKTSVIMVYSDYTSKTASSFS